MHLIAFLKKSSSIAATVPGRFVQILTIVVFVVAIQACGRVANAGGSLLSGATKTWKSTVGNGNSGVNSGLDQFKKGAAQWDPTVSGSKGQKVVNNIVGSHVKSESTPIAPLGGGAYIKTPFGHTIKLLPQYDPFVSGSKGQKAVNAIGKGAGTVGSGILKGMAGGQGSGQRPGQFSSPDGGTGGGNSGRAQSNPNSSDDLGPPPDPDNEPDKKAGQPQPVTGMFLTNTSPHSPGNIRRNQGVNKLPANSHLGTTTNKTSWPTTAPPKNDYSRAESQRLHLRNSALSLVGQRLSK